MSYIFSRGGICNFLHNRTLGSTQLDQVFLNGALPTRCSLGNESFHQSAINGSSGGQRMTTQKLTCRVGRDRAGKDMRRTSAEIYGKRMERELLSRLSGRMAIFSRASSTLYNISILLFAKARSSRGSFLATMHGPKTSKC